MIVNNGLKGVVALESDISRIDGEKGILEYRGYNIHDLAKNSSFEEVAFLLLNGNLPTKSELKKFSEELAARRALPRKIFDILNSLPTINYPTVILRTIYSYLAEKQEFIIPILIYINLRVDFSVYYYIGKESLLKGPGFSR